MTMHVTKLFILIFTTLWANSADDKLVILIFPRNIIWNFMQIVSTGGNLHEMSNPVFWEKLEKYVKMLSAENFIQSAKHEFLIFLVLSFYISELDFHKINICRWTNIIQSNLNSSNTDGSFTMANSNSFLSSYEILPLAQENKYLGKFSYFIMKLYVVCTH